jgi:CDP-6-deoxy-D-xylo-4-hexulose-3-dehydrase
LPHSIHNALTNAEWIDANGFFVGNHQFDIVPQLKKLRKVLVGV